MSFLLRDPTTVVLVGASPDTSGVISEAVTNGVAEECIVVSSPARGHAILESNDDVGCVIVCDDELEREVADVCVGIREEYPDLPIIAYVSESETDVGDFAAIADCRLVPRSGPDGRLRVAIDDAIETFQRRRRHRADSSMFTTLLQEGETPTYVKDVEGRHVRMADVEYSIDPAEVIGKTDPEVWGDETPEMARKTYEEDLEVIESEEAVYDQDEKFEQEDYTYWSRTTKVPWYDYDGELRGLVGISRDITEHVNAVSELEEQRQLVEQFTSYVSHDLKTPLQIASGALELARETGDGDAFDKIETTLDRMDETIDDLAELANQKADTTDFSGDDSVQELAEMDADETVPTPRLASLVSAVWDVVGVEAASLDIAVPEEATITADEETIRPLVENLLKNALVHAGPDVSITVGLTDDRGFYVADDGPGIPESERDAVLQEGYTTDDDGTGTGLHIVDEVAEQNGWELTITDAAGGGARIEVNDCFIVADSPRAVPTGDPIELVDDRSIGPVNVEGSAEYAETVDRWIITGAGENIWGDTNQFHFAYGEATPPIRIEARVKHLDAVDEYSKTGLMIRAGLDSDAPFGFIGPTSGHGSEVLWREGDDSPTESTQLGEAASAYEWYRLDYIDGTVTCSLSADGGNWTPVDQRDLDLGETVYVGLVVCSHDNRIKSVAEFEDLTVSELRPDRDPTMVE